MIFRGNILYFSALWRTYKMVSNINSSTYACLWSECWNQQIDVSDGWNDYVFEKDLS